MDLLLLLKNLLFLPSQFSKKVPLKLLKFSKNSRCIGQRKSQSLTMITQYIEQYF